MSFNISITETVQEKMSDLIDWLSDVSKAAQTAHEVEARLWWEMLSLGQQLMQVFLTIRSRQRRAIGRLRSAR